MITKEEIESYLSYNSDTGVFTRNGKQCGTLVNGYIRIGIKYKYYFAHHLVWILVYGKQPGLIDHINGIKDDNRICNLREVNQRLNCQNRTYHRLGKLVGASFHEKKNVWKSRINFNNKTLNLGTFKNEIDAHNEYIKALDLMNQGVDLFKIYPKKLEKVK